MTVSAANVCIKSSMLSRMYIGGEPSVTLNALKELQKATIVGHRDMNLVDISKLEIDRTKPIENRVIDFIEAVGNPYLFRVDDMAVKISFNPSGKTLTDAVARILSVS